MTCYPKNLLPSMLFIHLPSNNPATVNQSSSTSSISFSEGRHVFLPFILYPQRRVLLYYDAYAFSLTLSYSPLPLPLKAPHDSSFISDHIHAILLYPNHSENT